METNGNIITELPLVLDVELKHIAQLDELLESVKKICDKHNHIPYLIRNFLIVLLQEKKNLLKLN